jgi:2-hydroxychromene-2-carboxylate isomerase
VTDVEYFFDPTCPWTWLTSRWLADAAPRRDVQVTWRPLSLLVLSGGHMPEQYLAGATASHRALRGVAALHTEGRHADTGHYYATLGRLTHDAGEGLSDELVDRAVAETGLTGLAAALEDSSWDAAVEASTKEALDLAGPDVGSPILAWSVVPDGEAGSGATARRVGFHGPIVSPGPRGEEGARLLEGVLVAGATPGFFELKRGRTEPPALPAPPWG